MPSTTINFPGKLWGLSSASIHLSLGELEGDRAAEDFFEPFSFSPRAPEFQLGIGACGEGASHLLILDLTAHVLNYRTVAPVEAVGKTKQGGADVYHTAKAGRERGIRIVLALRRSLAMISGNVGDHFDFSVREVFEFAM